MQIEIIDKNDDNKDVKENYDKIFMKLGKKLNVSESALKQEKYIIKFGYENINKYIKSE